MIEFNEKLLDNVDFKKVYVKLLESELEKAVIEFNNDSEIPMSELSLEKMAQCKFNEDLKVMTVAFIAAQIEELGLKTKKLPPRKKRK